MFFDTASTIHAGRPAIDSGQCRFAATEATLALSEWLPLQFGEAPI